MRFGKNLPDKINLLFFLIVLGFSLTIKWDPSLWGEFSDTYDYIAQSKIPLTDKDFYFPQKTANFYPRPFTVPLFYKLASSNPALIIPAQLFFHTLSTFFLVFSLLLFIKRDYTKILIILFVYALMSWWNVLGWSITLLSESISFSFMLLWIASFLTLLKKRTPGFLILHVIIAVLFSFSRDSWLYFLIPFYSIVLFFSFFWDRIMVKKYLILLSFSITLFFIQNYAVHKGYRHHLAVLNNIVFNVLPNEEYLQWFAKQGMPCIDKLKANYSELSCEDKKIYGLYNDSTYNELFEWVDQEGKTAYMKFLITHPSHTFLFDETPKKINRIFGYDLTWYTGTAKDHKWVEYTIFPLFNLWSILILGGILVITFVRKKEFILLLPAILIVMFTFNALIVYNAEAMEVERHLIITLIVMQLIGIISIAFILDSDPFNGLIKSIKTKILRLA